MIPKDIFSIANLKADDNIPVNTLYVYFNQGVNRLNSECGLKLPSINAETINNDYVVSDETFVNDNIGYLLVSYIAAMIKQVEGYPTSDNVFFSEFASLQLQFNSKFKYLIKPEYKLTPEQNGSLNILKKKQIPKVLTRTRMW